MSLTEALNYPTDGWGWRADVLARLNDILARKAVPAREAMARKFTRFVRRFEGAIPAVQFRSAVQEVLRSLRRERGETLERALDRELEELRTQIREYRRRESIENYSEFLFSVEIKL